MFIEIFYFIFGNKKKKTTNINSEKDNTKNENFFDRLSNTKISSSFLTNNKQLLVFIINFYKKQTPKKIEKKSSTYNDLSHLEKKTFTKSIIYFLTAEKKFKMHLIIN